MSKLELYEQTTLDFGFEEEKESKKYVKSIKIPQYEPTGEDVPTYMLVDTIKVNKLIEKINKSNVSFEDKKFLKFAAMRHLVFNYSLIAEYYANASKEMQELMEESALVIIDINDAIANGYVKLTKNIEEIMKSTGKEAKEVYHNQTTPKGSKK